MAITDDAKVNAKTHQEGCGEVGETGEHGDLGENAAGAIKTIAAPAATNAVGMANPLVTHKTGKA